MRLHLLPRFARSLLALGLGLAAAFAHAEFPDHPIKLVVGFGPGTGSDIQARAFADMLGRELGTSVYVENKPGASGLLAANYVQSSPPDGYTLIFGTTLLVTLPLLSPAARYDASRDFTAIGGLAKAPFIVMTANKPGAPASLKELIERMKTSTVSFGSIGNGSFSHTATVRLMQQAGVKAVHVPYKASPQELQDVIAGNLLFATDSTTAGLPMIHSGLLRPLAVTTRTRLASLPDVPTVAEVLGTDFEHTVWTGLLAPAGVPPATVRKLSAATAAALATPEVQKRFAQMELQTWNIDADGFSSFIRTEIPAWKDFLKRNDIHIDE
jgi:tripartite-type tricarboxylate transporter receptor subunit TctC